MEWVHDLIMIGVIVAAMGWLLPYRMKQIISEGLEEVQQRIEAELEEESLED